jgi:hypothetical protein
MILMRSVKMFLDKCKGFSAVFKGLEGSLEKLDDERVC